MLSLAAELGGSRSKKSAGFKTADPPRDIHGNVKDIAPLDIQARVSRRPKPEAHDFARDSSAALLIWGDAHASLKPRPPPAARVAPPGSPAVGPQRPFCFMKHDRTEHRFLPDASPSDWRGTNVYVHAPGGGSTRTASEFGAWGYVENSRPEPSANTLSSTPRQAQITAGRPPASPSLAQPRPASASLTGLTGPVFDPGVGPHGQLAAQ
jgi:hypothetical protein